MLSRRALPAISTDRPVLVSEFRRVAGKEMLLFRLAEAAIARPDDTVRAVVYPVAGEKTLRDLVAEYKSSGTAYRRTVQTTLRASYTGHYRRGLIRLLEVLEFRTGSNACQPVIEALAPRRSGVARSTATSVAATAKTARRRGSMTGQAARAISQPATAAADQDSRPKITNAALAVSTTPMAGHGNRRMTAIGAVASMYAPGGCSRAPSDPVGPLPRYQP
jgi:hypothetical protein